MAPSVSQAQAPTVALPSVWRLEDLERVALQNNPTIGQADALIRSVQGRRLQAGLYPNPLVGVSADDIKARAPSQSKYFLWVQQTVITGDKRQTLLNAVRQEQRHAEGEQEIQRQRVLNAVRVAFYEALGLTRMVELRRDLARIAREAVEISEELFNIGRQTVPMSSRSRSKPRGPSWRWRGPRPSWRGPGRLWRPWWGIRAFPGARWSATSRPSFPSWMSRPCESSSFATAPN